MCLYLSGNLRRYIYIPKIQNLKTVIATKNMLLGSILSSDMDSTYLKTPISIFCLLFYHDIFAIFTSFAHPKNPWWRPVTYLPMAFQKATITHTHPIDKLRTRIPPQPTKEAQVVLSLLFLSIL